MTSWETRRRRGDVSVSSEVWETEYSGEKWDFLDKISELDRYSVIAGYIAYLRRFLTISLPTPLMVHLGLKSQGS